jgi:hypothetical protein
MSGLYCGSWLGQGAGCCEHGDEPSGSTSREGFIDWLKNYQFLKNDSAFWSFAGY